MIHEHVVEKNKELNKELISILGRPNFACARIASTLRSKGFKCPEKAEEEQALVIHTLLTFYDRYGDGWQIEFANYLSSE